MRNPSRPSGIDSVSPPTPGSSPSSVADHYITQYELQFKRARRTVKRRASGVTIAASILTGSVAVLGAVSAVLAGDGLSIAVALLTTALSSTVTVLLAWNDHFHHRELWIQRSNVLAEINELRRSYSAREALPWPARRSERVAARDALDQLNAILRRDLESWRRIQGG